MNPLVLAVWILFAAAVISPVGHWVARLVRRVRTRRRLRPLHEPLALPDARVDRDVRGLLSNTLALRERLRGPMSKVDEYVGALPVLEIALHLSKALHLRSGWGASMRKEFENAVSGAYDDVEQWVIFVEGQDEGEQDALIRLGLSAGTVRRLVADHRDEASGWAHDFGTGEDARKAAERFERLVRELDGFARTLVEGQRDPYR